MIERNDHQRKLDLTLDQRVRNMQAAWTKSRDFQLYAFQAAVSVLEFARANPDDFRVYCQDRSIRGDLPETQVAELMIQSDPDAHAISRERRGEYGAAIAWFADRNLCPDTDAEKAVHLAKQKGRINGVAGLYRRHRDIENPGAAATKARVGATKAANAVQAKLRTSAAANSTDTTSHASETPRDNNGDEVKGSVFYSRRDPSETSARASRESTDTAKYSDRRADLAEEFGRKLDEAGVVSCSRGDLPGLGVGLFLVIHDQSNRQPRMFEIVQTETDLRLLVDTIIKWHRELPSAANMQAD
jgi:hypothetical protein